MCATRSSPRERVPLCSEPHDLSAVGTEEDESATDPKKSLGLASVDLGKLSAAMWAERHEVLSPHDSARRGCLGTHRFLQVGRFSTSSSRRGVQWSRAFRPDSSVHMCRYGRVACPPLSGWRVGSRDLAVRTKNQSRGVAVQTAGCGFASPSTLYQPAVPTVTRPLGPTVMSSISHQLALHQSGPSGGDSGVGTS